MSTLIAKISRLVREKRNFIIYAIIGVSGASLDWLVFIALTSYLPAIHYLLSNIISTSCGITNNFILNAKFNFGVRDRLLYRFIAFASVGILGIGISSVILYLYKNFTPVPIGIAKGVTIFVIVIVQYNLNRRIAFYQHQKKDNLT